MTMCGRLICDTAIASQDLVKCNSSSLTDLAFSEVGAIRVDMDSDAISYFTKNGTLELELARRGSFDAYLAISITIKLKILPLTRQLSNLSGSLW